MEHVLFGGMALADIDLYNPDLFVKGVPHDALRVLRHEAPVFFHKEPNGARGFSPTPA